MDESPGDERPVDPAIRAVLARIGRMTGEVVADTPRQPWMALA
jgi:hypothetical protein